MYEFDSRVRYSETDAQGRMTWLALMDYFQDCSVFHSEAVNLGVEVWTDAQKAWILSSWQICLNRMPRLGEQITTQTWAYGMKGFYGYRNFSMNGRDGERMAYNSASDSVVFPASTCASRPIFIFFAVFFLLIKKPLSMYHNPIDL